MGLPPLPLEQREVTSILVRTISPIVGPGLENEINEGPTAQAVMPVREIFLLFDMFVRPAKLLLVLMSVLICIVSGVSILVSIYNSMSERRHEIAVMRALGSRTPNGHVGDPLGIDHLGGRRGGDGLAVGAV